MLSNAFIPDTNVLIHDPKAIDSLREGGHTVIIPWQVVLELDRLKSKPDIGFDAREALRRLEKAQLSKCKTIIIDRSGEKFTKKVVGLKKDNPDHLIIATALAVAKTNIKDKKFKKVKFLSRDKTVRILAREIDKTILVEDYYKDESDVIPHNGMKEISVSKSLIKGGYFEHEAIKDVMENDGVVCYGDTGSFFAALRKGSRFKVIDNKIQALGIRPLAKTEADHNWPQTVALAQLLDPEIPLVFLRGGAGTGKTLLAVASALEQRSLYLQIVVTRPMVHLEDEDNMGFLPGNLEEKIAPWWKPIEQALNAIKMASGNKNDKSLITRLKDNKKIIFEPLDYIRGMTFIRNFLILDDSQNLTPHQVKTYITRAGSGCKIVFTGDLGQIDRQRKIDKRSSGLNFAINKLWGNKMVGVTLFEETIRSDLARLAEERL